MNKAIAIKCKAAVTRKLHDLVPLQGCLKTLGEKHFKKLRASILEHGICFPFFTWEHEGVVYVLDGHQRDKTLRKMAEEGYSIPPLPCATVEAADKREAAQKILLINSQYGKMSEESLDQFLAENDLSFLELSDELELPEIDERYFADPTEFAATGEDDQGKLDEKNPVTCPECGHEFVP